MVMQPCPACGAHNDVSIYVSGQKKPCSGCGLTFEVRRSEQTGGAPAEVEARPRPVRATRAQPPVAPQRRPVAKVVEAGAQKPAAQEPPRPAAPADRGKAAEPAPRAPQAAKTDQGAAGLEIPGFDLHEVIGKGGMGKVYRAVQHSLHREVAIKVLNEDLAKHPSFIKRFEKEAHSLAALQHPNIATIHDTSHVGPHYFLVMEYIGGLSLRHMLNQGRLPLDQIGELFGKLCRAVDHAHRNRVIHRDLKPENVLFTQGGVLKVVDFGLANILDQNGQWELTRTKVSMGTVNYMAPEQRKDAKHVDHRADIYSLGVMLYEMLTGELPLGRFEDPSRHRAGVPADLDRLVARMLDFEPDRRPQSAELVAATLERLASRAEGAVAVGRALPAPAPSDAQAAGVAPPAALPAA
ncbi:MAG TPA: protein kinase, partial [Myxococcota bacterium]|nr:protein kinase [Myxococcota bacterium]